MTPVGFETTISGGERPQTHALDRAANGTDYYYYYYYYYYYSYYYYYYYYYYYWGFNSVWTAMSLALTIPMFLFL
jgi:hypothetical protein